MKTEFDIKKLRKELHNCPEASMKEKETKKLLMNFIEENTKTMQVINLRQWFYVFKEGKIGVEDKKSIAFRADYDAVLCEDGKARHLCGHDGHSAVLAGFALWLDTAETKNDVYLIFQPGEETGEGAKICASLIRDKKIDEIYGFHNIPGYELNSVVLRDETFACASTGMEIKLTGKVSHAAYPENGNNPALVISKIVEYMDELIRQEHKGIVLGTVIGIELGSSSYGVSAGKGNLKLTLRSEYPDEYKAFVGSIENQAMVLSKEAGLECEITFIEEFPSTVNSLDCVNKIRGVASELNLETVTPLEPLRWSEDFGYYLMDTKGAIFGIGVGEKHAALHTSDYEFEDEIISTVIEIYKKLI